MRIVFMGTPDFASCSLQSLIDEKRDVVGVFTKTDTPKGRGMKMQFSPVKEIAIANDIPVFQPKTFKNNDVFQSLVDLKPDLIVVVAYGKILPQRVLELPKFGCVNVHGSLLPKYRGAAPIQWAVINGDKTTGITTMYMSKGLDEGDMILKDEVEILPQETSGELFERLKVLGTKTLRETIELIAKNEAPRTPQNNDEATFAPMLSKEMGNLDFNENASKIVSKIYGLNPWPSAYTFINGKKFKVHSAKVIETKSSEKGVVFDINDALCVGCGENTAVAISEIQAEGKKRMLVKEYLKGNQIEINTKLERE